MAQDNPRLYVGGVPKQATREDFEEYFRAKGNCDEIILMGNDPHRGFGFIQYSDPEVANQVLSEKHTLKGIQMGVKVATKKETRLFLGGLQSTVTEDKVRDMLTGYTLEKLQVFPERGIGFVTVVGSNDAVNRLLKQEQEIDGKKIRMTIANPRQSDLEGRGRGRGRGRDRGRGGSGWNSFVPGGGYGAPAYGYGGPPGYGYGGGYGAPPNPYGPPRGGYGGGPPRGGYGGGPPRGGYGGGRGSGYGGGRGGGQSTGYQTSTPQFGYNQPAGGYGQQDRGGAARGGGYQTTSPYNQQYSQQYAPY